MNNIRVEQYNDDFLGTALGFPNISIVADTEEAAYAGVVAALKLQVWKLQTWPFPIGAKDEAL